MNKEHFLTLLKIHLKHLTPPQREVILNDYEAQFDELLETGESESHVSQKLGNPVTIAEEILKEWGISPDNQTGEADDWQEIPTDEATSYAEFVGTKPTPSFFIRFCHVAAIILFNMLFMIWIIFTALAVLVAGWLAVIACLFAPILGLIALVLTAGSTGLLQLFISLALCGLGFIGLSLAIPITTYVIRFIYKYIVWTFNILRGDH